MKYSLACLFSLSVVSVAHAQTSSFEGVRESTDPARAEAVERKAESLSGERFDAATGTAGESRNDAATEESEGRSSELGSESPGEASPAPLIPDREPGTPSGSPSGASESGGSTDLPEADEPTSEAPFSRTVPSGSERDRASDSATGVDADSSQAVGGGDEEKGEGEGERSLSSGARGSSAPLGESGSSGRYPGTSTDRFHEATEPR